MLFELISGLSSLLVLLLSALIKGMKSDIKDLQEESKKILINYVHKDEFKDQIRDLKETLRLEIDRLIVSIERVNTTKTREHNE